MAVKSMNVHDIAKELARLKEQVHCLSCIVNENSRTEYTHTQTTANNTWVIDHNLNNSYPFVTVYDSSGVINKQVTAITVNSPNRVTITFTGTPSSGVAKIII